MNWWIKQKVLKVIMYVLLVFVFTNCFLFKICPTLYPEWLRDGIGIIGLFVFAYSFFGTEEDALSMLMQEGEYKYYFDKM